MHDDPLTSSLFDTVLLHWPEVRAAIGGAAALSRAPGGLINDTWFAGDGWVVQRLHPIFGPGVNDDIAALTPRLRTGGVPVPTIVATDTGAHGVTVDGAREGQGGASLAGTWRVLTRLPGATVHRVGSAAQARAAGDALGRFHTALLGADHRFAFARLGIHDTDAHMRRLDDALRAHADHRLAAAVAPLGAELLARWRAMTPPTLPRRIGHGDPKISNLLFGADDRVTGVIDLDTMGWTTVDAELGDALRSWCSTADESGAAPAFDLERYHDAVRGWIAAVDGWVTDGELAAIPAGVVRICTELAARFAADALEERYFGWDPSVAPTRGEHNLIRARNQLALATDAAEKTSAMQAALRR